MISEELKKDLKTDGEYFDGSLLHSFRCYDRYLSLSRSADIEDSAAMIKMFAPPRVEAAYTHFYRIKSRNPDLENQDDLALLKLCDVINQNPDQEWKEKYTQVKDRYVIANILSLKQTKYEVHIFPKDQINKWLIDNGKAEGLGKSAGILTGGIILAAYTGGMSLIPQMVASASFTSLMGTIGERLGSHAATWLSQDAEWRLDQNQLNSKVDGMQGLTRDQLIKLFHEHELLLKPADQGSENQINDLKLSPSARDYIGSFIKQKTVGKDGESIEARKVEIEYVNGLSESTVAGVKRTSKGLTEILTEFAPVIEKLILTFRAKNSHYEAKLHAQRLEEQLARVKMMKKLATLVAEDRKLDRYDESAYQQLKNLYSQSRKFQLQECDFERFSTSISDESEKKEAKKLYNKYNSLISGETSKIHEYKKHKKRFENLSETYASYYKRYVKKTGKSPHAARFGVADAIPFAQAITGSETLLNFFTPAAFQPAMLAGGPGLGLGLIGINAILRRRADKKALKSQNREQKRNNYWQNLAEYQMQKQRFTSDMASRSEELIQQSYAKIAELRLLINQSNEMPYELKIKNAKKAIEDNKKQIEILRDQREKLEKKNEKGKDSSAMIEARKFDIQRIGHLMSQYHKIISEHQRNNKHFQEDAQHERLQKETEQQRQMRRYENTKASAKFLAAYLQEHADDPKLKEKLALIYSKPHGSHGGENGRGSMSLDDQRKESQQDRDDIYQLGKGIYEVTTHERDKAITDLTAVLGNLFRQFDGTDGLGILVQTSGEFGKLIGGIHFSLSNYKLSLIHSMVEKFGADLSQSDLKNEWLPNLCFRALEKSNGDLSVLFPVKWTALITDIVVPSLCVVNLGITLFKYFTGTTQEDINFKRFFAINEKLRVVSDFMADEFYEVKSKLNGLGDDVRDVRLSVADVSQTILNLKSELEAISTGINEKLNAISTNTLTLLHSNDMKKAENISMELDRHEALHTLRMHSRGDKLLALEECTTTFGFIAANMGSPAIIKKTNGAERGLHSDDTSLTRVYKPEHYSGFFARKMNFNESIDIPNPSLLVQHVDLFLVALSRYRSLVSGVSELSQPYYSPERINGIAKTLKNHLTSFSQFAEKNGKLNWLQQQMVPQFKRSLESLGNDLWEVLLNEHSQRRDDYLRRLNELQSERLKALLDNTPEDSERRVVGASKLLFRKIFTGKLYDIDDQKPYNQLRPSDKLGTLAYLATLGLVSVAVATVEFFNDRSKYGWGSRSLCATLANVYFDINYNTVSKFYYLPYKSAQSELVQLQPHQLGTYSRPNNDRLTFMQDNSESFFYPDLVEINVSTNWLANQLAPFSQAYDHTCRVFDCKVSNETIAKLAKLPADDKFTNKFEEDYNQNLQRMMHEHRSNIKKAKDDRIIYPENLLKSSSNDNALKEYNIPLLLPNELLANIEAFHAIQAINKLESNGIGKVVRTYSITRIQHHDGDSDKAKFDYDYHYQINLIYYFKTTLSKDNTNITQPYCVAEIPIAKIDRITVEAFSRPVYNYNTKKYNQWINFDEFLLNLFQDTRYEKNNILCGLADNKTIVSAPEQPQNRAIIFLNEQPFAGLCNIFSKFPKKVFYYNHSHYDADVYTRLDNCLSDCKISEDLQRFFPTDIVMREREGFHKLISDLETPFTDVESQLELDKQFRKYEHDLFLWYEITVGLIRLYRQSNLNKAIKLAEKLGVVSPAIIRSLLKKDPYAAISLLEKVQRSSLSALHLANGIESKFLTAINERIRLLDVWLKYETLLHSESITTSLTKDFLQEESFFENRNKLKELKLLAETEAPVEFNEESFVMPETQKIVPEEHLFVKIFAEKDSLFHAVGIYINVSPEFLLSFVLGYFESRWNHFKSELNLTESKEIITQCIHTNGWPETIAFPVLIDLLKRP